jgi:hypothetical protein
MAVRFPVANNRVRAAGCGRITRLPPEGIAGGEHAHDRLFLGKLLSAELLRQQCTEFL